MTLHDFLEKNKEEILVLSEKKTIELAALRPNSDELQKGLPIFFDQLIKVLAKNRAIVSVSDETKILDSAGLHGKELMRLGYTLSHVVHAYGAICQAITQVASDTKAPVTALEFHNLNRCLDIAIAGAVTQFEAFRIADTKAREVEHLGSLAHELRNALSRATVASEMINKGIVGASGSTAQVLKHSLNEMHVLLERSLAEIKLRANTEVHNEEFLIIEMINLLLVTAEVEAGARKQTITTHIDTSLQLCTDRHLLLSALGNLVQNAMKYSKSGGHIRISAQLEGRDAVIEVRDECGGIAPDKIAEMFKPFTQISADKSGLGLGLNIARKAIDHCGGRLAVENVPGGCCFKLSLPAFQKTEDSPPTVV